MNQENKKLEWSAILSTAAVISMLVVMVRTLILVAMLIMAEDAGAFFLKTMAWLVFSVLMYCAILIIELKKMDWKPRHQYLLDLLAESRSQLADAQNEKSLFSARAGAREFEIKVLSEKMTAMQAQYEASLRTAREHENDRVSALQDEFQTYKSVTTAIHQKNEQMTDELSRVKLELNAMRLLASEVVFNGTPAGLEGLIRKVISSNPSTFTYIEV